MRHWRQSMLLAVLGTFLRTASPALADVDLTGPWQLFVTGLPPSVQIFATFTQTGSALTMVTGPVPSAPFTGTIDPGTGVFTLNGGPYTQAGAPPGPDRIMTGTADPGGNSLAGEINACVWEPDLGWGCAPFDVTGVRLSQGTCGDGTVDAGEACDLGAANGGTCCTSFCTLVDPDGDGVCAADDNCPGVANANQSDFDDEGLGDACSAGGIAIKGAKITAARDGLSARSLAVNGSFTSSTLFLPTNFQVLYDFNAFSIDVGLMPAWAAKVCTATPSRIRCKSPDRVVSLALSFKPATSTVNYNLRVKNPPAVPPFPGPVSLIVTSATGFRGTFIDGCVTNAAGSVRCR